MTETKNIAINAELPAVVKLLEAVAACYADDASDDAEVSCPLHVLRDAVADSYRLAEACRGLIATRHQGAPARKAIAAAELALEAFPERSGS